MERRSDILRWEMKGRLIVLWLLSIGMLSCGGGFTRWYLNPKADVSYVKRVAVFPLLNHSRDNLAHEKVRDILETELLITQRFEVVDRGEVDRVMREMRIRGAREISPRILMKAASRLGVHAVIMGAVEEYAPQTGGGSVPVVTLSLKLLDAQSAKVIWQATGTEKGGGALNRLFGIGEKSVDEVAQILIRRLLRTLI